ncbi:MAG: feruloyl esterase, partial [Fibrobacter sp.]|nr:feruloyl esterase [Fibrobacter sp.]
MRVPHILGVASSIAMFSSMAFGWSISGNVVNEMGQAIPGVAINSFNYAGISTTSDNLGAFSLSNEIDALLPVAQSGISVQKQGSLLSIANQNGKEIKVTLMDALGKVAFQDNFSTSVQIDMQKFGGQKMMILRVTSQSTNENYIVTKSGVSKNSLRKEGDPLATFQFSKEGFANTVYTMAAEVETGVKITMKAGTNQPNSSNSVPPSSSSVTSNSSVTPASSSSTPDIVNCAGKTHQSGNFNDSVTVDGKTRTFIMHVPDAYKGDKPVPLVIDYHPIGG